MTEPAATPSPGLVGRLYAPFRTIAHEIAKFGIIGMVSYVIDVGAFNILLFFGPLADKPLTAKAVSVAIATTFAYFGNRYWTFRDRGRTGMAREYVLFFLLNGAAMAIALGCLAVSHYLLGLTTPLADNISANVIGLVAGTVFRFWSYRKWVFPAVQEPPDGPGGQSGADQALMLSE